MYRILIVAALLPPVCSQAAILCPDGSYVGSGFCRLAPDGRYVSGSYGAQLSPNGTYTSGQPRLAPDGTYVGGHGPLTLCPDGSYANGRCQLAPDGTYVGAMTAALGAGIGSSHATTASVFGIGLLMAALEDHQHQTGRVSLPAKD
jgi:hypothetical protein